MQRTIIAGLAAVGLGFILAGCHHVKNGPIANNAPDWVNKGGGAFKDKGQDVFYGVGIFRGSMNPALARDAADDRARADVAKILNTYVADLQKDYMEAVTAGDQSKTSDEQLVSETMKSFTKITLTGAVIVDHWKDPSDGTLYSLCKLDMNSMQKTLDQAKELDSKVRDYVKANAEKAFDDLTAEESKSH